VKIHLVRRGLFGALLALALAACNAAPDAAATVESACGCGGEMVVDPALMAFLSKARAAHHEADLAIEADDKPAAVRALERVTRGPRPAAATGAGREIPPEAAEVLADTHARIADLRSEAGDFARALREIDAGLALAQKPTHFRGHLFEVQGVVLERQSKALREQSDAAGAERARAAAMDAFETAMKVQDQVILDALGDASAPLDPAP
jgi:hypothetical protein